MTCDVCYFDVSHENMHSLLKMENEDTSYLQREIIVESLNLIKKKDRSFAKKKKATRKNILIHVHKERTTMSFLDMVIIAKTDMELT